MSETLICALDEGPSGAAVTAFGIWLGECLGARPRVCSAQSPAELLAVASEHHAGLIVLAEPGEDDSAGHDRVRDVRSAFAGAVLELPATTIDEWMDPPLARARARSADLIGRLADPHAAMLLSPFAAGVAR